MTPSGIKAARRALGLTQSALGQALGLSPDNADRVVRRWEGGETPISGPAAVALTYLSQGALDDAMRRIIPEHVVAADAVGEIEHEIVLRLWRPRCLMIVTDDPVGQAVAVDGGIEHLSVAMWIDDPSGFDEDALLRRAAAAFSAHTADSFEG